MLHVFSRVLRSTAVPLVVALLSVSPGAHAAAPVTPALEVLSTLQGLAPTLNREALAAALRAHAKAKANGRSTSSRVAVIDYALPSTERRLWVFDVDRRTLLFHELVAHGRGSGELVATSFGNEDRSHKTSLGVFVAAETYVGQHGYSLRLDGLDRGFNDHARDRAIVVHAADYATADFAAKRGRLGLSWGCPAVAPDVARPLIDALAGGGVLVAWYPDQRWLDSSDWVK